MRRNQIALGGDSGGPVCGPASQLELELGGGCATKCGQRAADGDGGGARMEASRPLGRQSVSQSVS